MSGNVNFYTREERRVEVSCDGQGHDETEFWTVKILAYCLEKVVFGNTSPPKISPEAIASIQNAVIILKTMFRENPFLDSGVERKGQKGNHRHVLEKDLHIVRLGNSSVQESTIHQFISFASANSSGRGNGTVGSLFNFRDIGFESKTVLRTLVSRQLINLAREIIRIYQPLLQNEGFQCDIENVEGPDGDQYLAETLLKITSLLQNIKDECISLDQELEEVRDEIRTQSECLENNLKEFTQAMDLNCEYLSSDSCPDVINRYHEYLRKRNEDLLLKKCVFELEVKLESNPPDLVKDIEQSCSSIQNEILNLESEIKASERLLEGYESLGPEYTDLLQQYKDVEEQIATKEWVIKQYDSSVD